MGLSGIGGRQLGAQASRELRIDAGIAEVRQLGRDGRAAVILGAEFRTADARFASIVSASATIAGDSATAGQGLAALAWRPRPTSRWSTEGGVGAAVFGVYELGRGASQQGWLHERVVLDSVTLSLGGAAGRTRRDGISSHATSADLGAVVRRGRFVATAALARVRSSDWPLLTASQIFLTRDASSYDLIDRSLGLSYSESRLTLELTHSWRSGQLATHVNQSAFRGAAEWSIRPRIAVNIAGGRQLADPVRGTPDANFLSLMLRFLAFPWRVAEVIDVQLRAFASLAPVREGTLLTVRVSASEGQRVEVAGSFSGWEPVPLRRTADGWEAQVTLGRGQHRVAVRIDGGPWRAPANLGAVRDDFGGSAGLVVVP